MLELAFGPFIRYLCYKIWLNHLLTGACNSVSDNYNVIFIFYWELTLNLKLKLSWYIYVNCMGFFRKNKYLKPYFLEKASTFQICLTRKSKRYKQAWKVYIKGFKTLKQIVNLHILSILLFHLHIYIYIWNSFYM